MKDFFCKKFFLPFVLAFTLIGCLMLGGIVNVANSDISVKYIYDGDHKGKVGINTGLDGAKDPKVISFFDDQLKLKLKVPFDSHKNKNSTFEVTWDKPEELVLPIQFSASFISDTSILNHPDNFEKEITKDYFGIKIGSKDTLLGGFLKYDFSITGGYKYFTAYGVKTAAGKSEQKSFFLEQGKVANTATKSLGVGKFDTKFEMSLPLEVDIFFLEVGFDSNLTFATKHLSEGAKLDTAEKIQQYKTAATAARNYMDKNIITTSPLNIKLNFGLNIESTLEDDLELIAKPQVVVSVDPFGKRVFLGGELGTTGTGENQVTNVIGREHVLPGTMCEGVLSGEHALVGLAFDFILKDENIKILDMFMYTSANFGYNIKDGTYIGVAATGDNSMESKKIYPLDTYLSISLKPIEDFELKFEGIVNAPFFGHTGDGAIIPKMMLFNVKFKNIFDIVDIGSEAKLGVDHKDGAFSFDPFLKDKMKSSKVTKDKDYNEINGSLEYVSVYKSPLKKLSDVAVGNFGGARNKADIMKLINSTEHVLEWKVLTVECKYPEFWVDKVKFEIFKYLFTPEISDIAAKEEITGDGAAPAEVGLKFAEPFKKLNAGFFPDKYSFTLTLRPSLPMSNLEWVNGFVLEVVTGFEYKVGFKTTANGAIDITSISSAPAHKLIDNDSKTTGYEFSISFEFKYDPKTSPLSFMKMVK